ncbi:ABC transporter permease [Actinoplanes sp. NBC_00393]|uniref:FtsX-like permease family protein n=1 Tax=Actinoplanes sp. NBC_00393 TaxID=2975953 RepID=UPI002E1E03CE
MRLTLRRARAFAGHLALLAVLAFAAAVLVSALPRAANTLTDQGLRADLGALPAVTRDLVHRAGSSVPFEVPPASAAARLPAWEAGLPAPLPGLVRDRWFSATTGPTDIRPSGPPPYSGSCRPEVRLRYQSGFDTALRLISGRLPRPAATTEVLVTTDAPGLRPGSTLRLESNTGSAPVTVVGVFQPDDAASAYWAASATEPIGCVDPREGMTSRITLLTDIAGITRAGRATGVLAYEWRYALAVERVRAADLASISRAVSTARRAAPAAQASLITGLDTALAGFERQLRGVRAMLAVVRAGLLATVAGLIVLTAQLVVDRRRAEFALLRARGAGTRVVVGRTLRETALVVPVMVLGGRLLAQLVPGRPDPGDGILLAAVGLLALFATPLFAARLPSTRSPSASSPAAHSSFVDSSSAALLAGRGGAGSARRLCAELFVLLLAVLGVVLVRQRGLAAADGVDPYLVSVPVLLGTAAALLTVRLLPWPLSRLGRVTARARGAVPFLGLARAGRGSPVQFWPLAVLVVAVATGVFTASVSGTVSDARDRATDQETAADARVDGFAFAPDTTRALAAVPGVDAVAPLVLSSGTGLTGASGEPVQAQLLVIDGSAAAPVLRAGLPAVLTRPPTADPAPADGPVPAVVSPEVAAEIGSGGIVDVQGRRYRFRVAAVTGSLPTLQPGARRFIALPSQALPVPGFQPLIPNRFLVSGDGFSTDALRVAGDQGQQANLERVLGRPVTPDELARPATVTTWSAHRAALGRGGVNGVLAFAYTTGAAGAAVLALLAVALSVLADAPGRGRSLSRLRTMGLSLRQGRHLLIYEVAPLVAAAFVAGGSVGVLLPRLLGPALDLPSFSAGVTGRSTLDPLLVPAAFLLLTAALAVVVAVESLANRRMRLGEVLRLGP